MTSNHENASYLTFTRYLQERICHATAFWIFRSLPREMKKQTGWTDERAQILVNINVRSRPRYLASWLLAIAQFLVPAKKRRIAYRV